MNKSEKEEGKRNRKRIYNYFSRGINFEITFDSQFNPTTQLALDILSRTSYKKIKIDQNRLLLNTGKQSTRISVERRIKKTLGKTISQRL